MFVGPAKTRETEDQSESDPENWNGIMTERLRRPAELTTHDPDDSSQLDSDESAELELVPTVELKQLLEPASEKTQGADDADEQIDGDVDDDGGFDPYNHI